MVSFDCSKIPRCTIDYSLEISPEEISSLSGPINTLLKCSYLVGTSFEIETTIDTLFDIAEEVASVEACGFLLQNENDPGVWELKISRRLDPSPPREQLSYLVAPAAISSHFGKAVSMDPDWGPWSSPICQAWSSRSLVAFPLRRDREVFGALVFGKRESHPFSKVQVKLLWALSLQSENYFHHTNSSRAQAFYSFLDPLTHLYGRRYFDSQIEKEILRSRRIGEPFSLLFIHIDSFKTHADRLPETASDIALQEFAEILGSCAREVDTVARLGGNEFAIILPHSNTEGAHTFSSRIIGRLAQHGLPGAGETRTERLSVSVGVASFPADAFDKTGLVTKADLALQRAKERGGGNVCLYQDAARIVNEKAYAELPVRKIFDASRSVVDMDKFLEILLFTGMQGLGAMRGSIVVKNPSGDFVLRASIGFSRHEVQITSAAPLRPGGVTSWVVDHQIPLVVSNPEDSPLPPPRKKNGYNTDSFLSIPLICAGQTLGVLHLTNRKDQRPFTREDLQRFAPIASEIAGILEKGIRFQENVRTLSDSILSSLSGALELRYPFLSGHSHRVRDISIRVGEKMGLGMEDLDALRRAAVLHDVGIVGVPGNLLSLKRQLSDNELEEVRKHPFWGAKMLEGVPGLESARRSILEHHEHFDGSGYPYRLRGEDLSLNSKILAIAEFYDSILTDRPYKQRVSPDEALRMVEAGSGTLFDPDAADAFLETAGGDPLFLPDSTH